MFATKSIVESGINNNVGNSVCSVGTHISLLVEEWHDFRSRYWGSWS